MRKILLAVLALEAVLLSAAPRAGAEVWVSGGLGWNPPVVVIQPAPPPLYYGPPVYPYVAAYPYPYAHGYFRPYAPYAPYAWNPDRNWRDTWQDDGTKVHGYTLP